MRAHATDTNVAQSQPAAATADHTGATCLGTLPGGLRAAQHSAMQTWTNQSPRMLAQRRAIGAAFRPASQGAPNAPKDAVSLQRHLESAAVRREDGASAPTQLCAAQAEPTPVAAVPVSALADLTSARAEPTASRAEPVEARPNQTGMPNQLKAGIESLSGMDMSAVRVHRNSDKPAQLSALAYAQGDHIHLGPGQEEHLPHEAWHVVQQRQERVRETVQMAGVGVNDEVGLEREADLMGGRAVSQGAGLHLAGKRQDLTPNSHKRLAVDAVSESPAMVAQRQGLRAKINPLADAVRQGRSQEGAATTQRRAGIRGGPGVGVVQMLPLQITFTKYQDGEVGGIQLLSQFFTHVLKRELDEAATDDKKPSGEYAPWWKHQVLVSQERLSGLLTSGANEEAALHATNELVELLQYPAPVLELDPENHGTPRQEEFGSIGIREWDPEEANLLTGKKEALLNGNVATREEALDGIRGKDKKFHVGQGAILLDFIEEERKAILGLVSAAVGSDAIFSLERGGAMISDLIVRLGGIRRDTHVHKEPKIKGNEANKKLHMANFISQIKKFVGERDKDQKLVISIAETAVGGGSVNQLLTAIRKLSSELKLVRPAVHFKVLVARETIKNVNFIGEGRLKLRDPMRTEGGETPTWSNRPAKNTLGILYPEKLEAELGSVEMYVSQLRYLIGEDVEYQLSYENPHKPVIIFDEAQGELRGLSIEPSGPDDSARQILIDLVAGAYEGLLNKVFAEVDNEF
jgi:hypothetical protein